MRPIDITDYDKSSYDYTSFWVGRQYEDASEHLALKKLLPKSGASLIDLGGGFGRLSNLYAPKFTQCLLFDYSQNNLNQAKIRFEQVGIKNVKTLKGDIYTLPFANESFDTVLMIRVIHHLEQPEIAIIEVNRILKKEGFFILEFPNKIHFKNRLSEWLKGNFGFTKDLSPAKKTAQNGILYNYHPGSIQNLLQKTNFKILRKISVSNLRSPLLKRFVPLKILLIFENLLQGVSKLSLTHFFFGPSIFFLCQKEK